MALIPGLSRWPEPDRRALLALMRAKEGRRERPFALALQRHNRFLNWLRCLGTSG
jgi:hypothetical protein